ncbi:unnamed protein product [Ostreobium quekettii]|uniref:Uncharacterized protein n=1 Tax=Ostreobium quekettii TaxID=121088 RepID=A0A8S1IPC1_9CHLO|nr:unnamed protein product [Ostreobium quekettii]
MVMATATVVTMRSSGKSSSPRGNGQDPCVAAGSSPCTSLKGAPGHQKGVRPLTTPHRQVQSSGCTVRATAHQLVNFKAMARHIVIFKATACFQNGTSRRVIFRHISTSGRAASAITQLVCTVSSSQFQPHLGITYLPTPTLLQL